jgi:glutaredoxin
MKNKTKISTIGLVVLIVVIGIAVYFAYRPKSGNTLDAFAECLTAKGFTMYGLSSCPHCTAEKQLFESSFKYVNYVECSTDPQKCTADNVEAVPTWIEPDGQRLVGTQTLEALSGASGCKLPE